MTRLDEAYVELTVKDKKLRKGLKDVEKAVDSTGASLKRLGGIAAGAFGGVALTGFLQDSAKAALAQADAEQKLAGVLKATGDAAGFSAKQLNAYASELQKTTTFSDQTTISATAVLATFDKISGETFKEAISVAQDMSAAFGQNLTGAMTQLGKALQDPIKGVGALAEVGVSFSESQKETIKGLVETNELAKAQGIILGVLKGQFGGLAAEMAKTQGGKLKQLTNNWVDLKESIGFTTMAAADAAIGFENLNTKLEKLNESATVWGKLQGVASIVVNRQSARLETAPFSSKARSPSDLPGIPGKASGFRPTPLGGVGADADKKQQTRDEKRDKLLQDQVSLTRKLVGKTATFG